MPEAQVLSNIHVMEIHGAVFEELRSLAGKLSELETSNSVILKTLNERDRSSDQTIKPSQDLNGTLNFLTEKIRKSDKEWQILKECISRLDGRVDELSSTILKLAQVNNLPLQRTSTKPTGNVSSTPNSHSSRKHESQPTLSEKYALTSSGSVIDATSSASTSLKDQTRTGKDRNDSMWETQFRTKTESASNITPWQQRREQKQPLKSNNYGLRGRTVCTDVDNRVRLIKGENIEKGQQLSKTGAEYSFPVEETVKHNLPTKEELNLKSQTGEERPDSKQTIHRPVEVKNENKELAGHSKNPETVPGLVPNVTDLRTWKALAELERKRGLAAQSAKTGKGPNTCLLLDISGSMEGEAFNEMMAAVRTFIDGIAAVAAALGIEENIGIATFGNQTRVIHHMTNEYDKVLKAIDLLVPSGSSSMAAGLYMALACCLGYDRSTSIKDVPIKPRVIVFCDGRANMETSEQACYSESNRLSRMWLKEAAEDFKIRNLRIYPVSVSNTKPEFLEDVCQKTHGKMYKSSEIHKLIRMTQNIVEVIRMIGNGIDFKEMDLSFDSADDWEEIVHLGKFLSNTESAMNVHMEYKDSNLPPLGTRVRRGPDWMWGDQDEDGPGTVVGHDGMTSVWVVWDCGHRNTYRCSPLIGYDVLVVDELRILKGEMIAVGCLMERGENWKYENQDGGLGNIGVVIRCEANGSVVVRWPNMSKCQYKYGCDGLFEVKLCDPKKTHGNVSYPKTYVWGSRDSLGGADPSVSENVSALSTSDRLSNPSTQDKGANNQRPSDKMLTDKSGESPSVVELNKRNNRMQKADSGAGISIIWQYKKDDIWCDLPKDINLKTEKAYGRNRHGSTLLELDGHIWRASFTEMKMECQKTHTVTAIIRKDISK